MASLLFTQCLTKNECVFIIGTERICNYSGYGGSFTFESDYNDQTPKYIFNIYVYITFKINK